MKDIFLKNLKILFVWQLCNALFFFGLFILTIIFLLLAGVLSSMVSTDTSAQKYDLVQGEIDLKKGVILEIPLSGVIMKSVDENSFSNREGAYDRVISDIKKASSDLAVKAVIIRVNSPGGSVSASEALHLAIKGYKEKSGVPVYAFYDSVAASGGVYSTVCVDKIIADPTCITGSVGVIMGSTKILGLMDKIGISSEPFRSGNLKDMGSPVRESTEEEKALLQGMVDDLYQRFAEVILEGRGSKVSREVIDGLRGSFFLAKKAVEVGLVDEVGQDSDAYQMLREELGETSLAVVRYQGPNELEAWLKQFASSLTESPLTEIQNRLRLGLPMYILTP